MPSQVGKLIFFLHYCTFLFIKHRRESFRVFDIYFAGVSAGKLYFIIWDPSILFSVGYPAPGGGGSGPSGGTPDVHLHGNVSPPGRSRGVPGPGRDV